MADGNERLADHLASLDAARFAGRAPLVARMDRLLTDPGLPTRVVFVHGPGGIGKSALLRQIGRLAKSHNRAVWAVDARSLDPVPGELERALAGTAGYPWAVVLIDSFERIPALESLLRERILPALSADALVVVAGRKAPGPAWFRDGWEHVVADVPLAPLPPAEAQAVLAALGVTEPEVVDPIVEWAAGSPLALNLAATTGDGPDVLDLAGVDLNRAIVERLVGDELATVDAEVLEVAALARAVDARLLAAVLPGRPTRAANEALRRCSAAELVGARVTLHDLVRAALRRDLRQRDPQRYRDLRCRIADHLHARAAAGEPRLLADLFELVEDPDVRWGIGGDPARFRIDPWRPDDVAPLVERYIARKGDPRWWDDLATLVALAPETGIVARDLAGTPVGFCIAVATSRVPDVAARDTFVAPVLADARARGAEQAIVFRESFAVSGPAGMGAAGTLHLAAELRSGLPNPQLSYILDSDVDDDSLAFFRAVGATHLPGLDHEVDGRRVACWLVDHGPGGILGQVRDTIRAEAGAPATDAAQRQDEDLRRAALEALRDFTRPGALATNPLAADLAADLEPQPGGGGRAGRLRDAVSRAVDAAFGSGPDDRLLHDVVALADLDAEVSHDQAMARLAISRATYFRRLRQARERVVDRLVEGLASPPTPV